MHQKIQRHRIAHVVAHQRAAIARLERVLMNPLPVWAADLLVHEPVRRLPDDPIGNAIRFEVTAPAAA